MHSHSLSLGWRAMLAIFSVTLLVANSSAATEQVLHTFNSNGKDGNSPYAGLILDKSCNLYGTTLLGGTNDYGTVFELTPQKGGGWREKILHDFDGADGDYPQAGVLMDASGNLYGTTFAGGVHGVGTIYELVPTGGRWTEKVLHSFSDNGKDGYQPYAGLRLSMPLAIFTAQLTSAALTVTERCSSYRPKLAAGARRYSTASMATAKTDSMSIPALPSTSPGIFTARLYGAARMRTAPSTS